MLIGRLTKRLFTAAAEILTDNQIKSIKSNYELLQVLKNQAFSPHTIALCLKTASLNQTGEIKDNSFTKSPEVRAVFNKIEDSLEDFSITEASHIISFIRLNKVSTNHENFSESFERSLFERANKEGLYIEDPGDFTHLYMNLALLKKVSGGMQRRLLEMLRDTHFHFKPGDLYKVLVGINSSSYNMLKLSVIEALKRLENEDLSNLSITELANSLKVLRTTDMQFSLGSKLINYTLEILLPRVNSFENKDHEKILEFYSATDDFDRTLLYSTLEAMSSSIPTFNKKELLEVSRHLAKIKNFTRTVKIDADIINSLIKIGKRMSEEKVLGHVEFAEWANWLSIFFNEIPKDLHDLFISYKEIGRNGYWEFPAYRVLKNFNSPECSKYFLSFDDFSTNITKSSPGVLLCIIENICFTSKYSENPVLIKILDACVDKICRELNSWSYFKQFIVVWELTDGRLDHTEAGIKIAKKAIEVHSKNVPGNKMFYMIDNYLLLYSNSPEIYSEWKNKLAILGQFIKPEDLSRTLMYIFDQKLIEPMLELQVTVDCVSLDAVAHTLSLVIKDPSEAIISNSIKLINRSPNSFINITHFTLSKFSIFTHVFTKGHASKIPNLISAIPKIINLGGKSKKVLSIARLLAENSALNVDLATSLFKKIPEPVTERDLHSYIAIASFIPNVLKPSSLVLKKLLKINDDYSLTVLHEKINTYFMLDFQLEDENEFLNQLEIKLATIEKRNVTRMLTMIESIRKASGIHVEFEKSLNELIVEVIVNKVNELLPAVLFKALVVFNKKNIGDDKSLEVLETRVKDFTLVADMNLQLIKAYAENKRFNTFFEAICKKLSGASAIIYKDELLAMQNSGVNTIEFNNLINRLKERDIK